MGFWYESAPGVSLGCRSTKARWFRPVITQMHANLPACFTTKISCLLPPQQQGPQAHHETCAPVGFRHESTPGSNISPHIPPNGHRVGFVCMGGTSGTPVWVSGPTRRHLGYPPYTQNQPNGHRGVMCWLKLPQGADTYRDCTRGGKGLVVS